ncbi:uncharacterized protein LOC100641322 [Amphimedon queenslandica]|uniref:Tcf n=1 Tax=Amphimedon queenslandica TaxID=400682 RepID=E2IJ94_AMPQE|nr:uncharacterized protein LOC100641322 [Amphimedon queenslandica]ADO16566.1 Tcf [Amphimedon queenslandica]|eukprot:NP_001292177.1 uncharacterized protein LOC100641322 [Amphimedon queenslandica]
MAATSAQPPPGTTGQPQPPGAAVVSSNGDPELATSDEVKEYCHEGEGEKTEHLNSMDLHDIKTELEKDAEESETPTTSSNNNPAATFNTSPSTTVINHTLQFRPTVVQPMVYAANGFMPFATGTSLYRPVKMEVQGTATDWTKAAANAAAATQGISIPYGYTGGFVSGLPIDQSLRPAAYPFLMPTGQYVTQMPYPQQLATTFGTAAPNAAVQPHSGIITPQQKEKKPHIKKPLNAFMLFMKEKRAEVIKECTLKESAAINQILGKMWHKLDKSEQAKYYEMAREERARHMQMYPGWSARDNYAAHKKRRKKRSKQAEGSDEPNSFNETEAVSEDANKSTEEPPLKKVLRVEDNNLDSPRKCRARFGMDQQQMWCGPCRRKKKCIRVEDDGSRDSTEELDDIQTEQSINDNS